MKPLVTRKPDGIRMSIADLALETGLSYRKVIKALAQGQEKGFLDIHDFDGFSATFNVKLPSKVAE